MEHISQDIRVLNKNAELRKPLYKDVEDLLCPGFISHPCRVGSVSISLRSLSPGDLFVLRARVPPDADRRTLMEWTLAACTWLVDGQVLLEDSRAALVVREILRDVHSGVLRILFSIFHGLYNRVNTALRRVESYCYETYSRTFWRMCGGQHPGREDFTGVPGSSRLGMNSIQKVWVAFNVAEDERLSDQVAWEHAKLIASAQAPKGIKRIDQADKRRLQKEEERRRAVQDRMYWEAVGRPDMLDRVTIRRPVTVEDLIEDMRKWVAGEKDEHDRIVDEYKNKIRERFESEMRAREEARRKLEKEAPLGSPLVGLDASSIPTKQGRRGVSTVFEDGAPAALYHRYLRIDPSPGRLAPGEDGVVVRSIDDEIQGRKVRFHVREDSE